ncbi:hypothetical protein MKW98_007355, partial [Papaver atlanticum]
VRQIVGRVSIMPMNTSSELGSVLQRGQSRDPQTTIANNTSVQASNSAGSHKAVAGLIPRRSPRFIGRGNTAESLDQGPHISEEQLANDRERRRVRQRTRQQNMTEEQRSSNLFEHVMHEHVQAEVARLLGRVSRVAMNTSEGYMELGPQHRGMLYLPYIQHLTICSSLMRKSTTQKTAVMRVTKRICMKVSWRIPNLIPKTAPKS